MRFGLHFLIVVGLILPFEVSYWLKSDLMRVNATVIDSRIIAPPRPRVAPIVLLDLGYMAEGSEHRVGVLTLEPADGRYNWRPEERAIAERFVLAHGAGSTVDIWVPRLLPSWGAVLAEGTTPPAAEPRNQAYIAYLSLLVVYLGGVLALKLRSKSRLTAKQG